jgi:aminoglycoside 6'-N-acetyltransferase I
MRVTIRLMEPADRAAWITLRGSLWPDEAYQTHEYAIDSLLRSGDAWGFMAEAEDGTPAGVAEVAIRKYANGCESQPVPFLEGIWVDEKDRRQGVGMGLINHVQTFLAARGFVELGSDTQIDNQMSQVAHIGWGFNETERVVYF